MQDNANVGDVQAPDLEKLISDATKEVETPTEPELTEANEALVPSPSTLPTPTASVPTTSAQGKGSGAQVRLLPSMKHKALNPGQHNAGMDSFEVPSKAEQEAGWYMSNGKKFVAQFRQFGFVQEKGKPQTQSVEI